MKEQCPRELEAEQEGWEGIMAKKEAEKRLGWSRPSPGRLVYKGFCVPLVLVRYSQEPGPVRCACELLKGGPT